MGDRYSHRERIEMIIRGEKPDRFAASVWRHFFHRESSADEMAAAMIDYQKRYDWDFMKINPRASYHTEDWGTRLEWSSDEFSKHRTIKNVINSHEDWDKIDILPITSPALSEHLMAISTIRKECGPDLPLLMTVFNPVGIARRLVGNREKFLEHLDSTPDQVKGAIERITVTFEKYVTEIRNAGADGLFFATLDLACTEAMTCERYNDLCRPSDLRILKASGNDALNLLHVCASNNYLKELSDYPARLINWDASDPTNINLEDSFNFIGQKTVVGGLDHKGWLWHSRPDEIAYKISEIRENMEGKKFIFGPGCTIEARIPHENIKAVRDNL